MSNSTPTAASRGLQTMNGEEVRIYDGRPTAFATVVSIHELYPADREKQLDLLAQVARSDEDEGRGTDPPLNTSASRR